MSVNLIFGHKENGSATAKMVLDSAPSVDFDYVSLVKHLFDNPDDVVMADIDDSYTEEQIKRLTELIKKIEATAKGRIADTQHVESTTLGEIPL